MNRLPRSARIRGADWVSPSLPVLVLGLALVAGCARFSSDPQRLPDSTFARVLTELHVVAARHDLDAPVPPSLRDSVFTHYGVSAADFDSTMRHYTRRPQSFKELYQPIIDTLQALQYRRPSDTTGAPRAPVPTP